MKPEIKVEGDNLIVKAELEHKVDTDGDGIAAASVTGVLEIKLDGSEVIDELLKNSSFLTKIKEKLGL